MRGMRAHYRHRERRLQHDDDDRHRVKRGRPPIGTRAMTVAERQRRFRAGETKMAIPESTDHRRGPAERADEGRYFWAKRRRTRRLLQLALREPRTQSAHAAVRISLAQWQAGALSDARLHRSIAQA